MKVSVAPMLIWMNIADRKVLLDGIKHQPKRIQELMRPLDFWCPRLEPIWRRRRACRWDGEEDRWEGVVECKYMPHKKRYTCTVCRDQWCTCTVCRDQWCTCTVCRDQWCTCTVCRDQLFICTVCRDQSCICTVCRDQWCTCMRDQWCTSPNDLNKCLLCMESDLYLLLDPSER